MEWPAAALGLATAARVGARVFAQAHRQDALTSQSLSFVPAASLGKSARVCLEWSHAISEAVRMRAERLELRLSPSLTPAAYALFISESVQGGWKHGATASPRFEARGFRLVLCEDGDTLVGAGPFRGGLSIRVRRI